MSDDGDDNDDDGVGGNDQCPKGGVFQDWVGFGQVLDKIPGTRLGSSRVGVLKYTIGYFQVSNLLSVFWGKVKIVTAQLFVTPPNGDFFSLEVRVNFERP